MHSSSERFTDSQGAPLRSDGGLPWSRTSVGVTRSAQRRPRFSCARRRWLSSRRVTSAPHSGVRVMAGSSSNSKTIPGTRKEMARSRILVAISSYWASTCFQVLVLGEHLLPGGLFHADPGKREVDLREDMAGADGQVKAARERPLGASEHE